MDQQMRRWLVSRYLRFWTKRAELDSRMLTGWCDYRPAHRTVKLIAIVDGRPFGQSCYRHSGALLVDASRTGAATLVPAERQKAGPSRLDPIVIE